MANDGNIKVNIDVITNMTNALKGLQDLSEKAKTHAKDINRTLESALKMPNTFGTGGGVFGSMLRSIKEMQKGISTVSTTIRSSMGEVSTAMNEVKKAVDTASSSIVNLSTSIKGLTGKSHKVRIEQEITTKGAKSVSGGIQTKAPDGSPSGIEIKNARDVKRYVGEMLSTGNFSIVDAREMVRKVAEGNNISMTSSQQRNAVGSLTRQFNLDTSPDVGQAAKLVQMKEAIERQVKDILSAESIRSADAKTVSKLSADIQKQDEAWAKEQAAVHNSFRRQQEKIEQERFNAEKDIHKQYVSHLKRQADLKIAYQKAQEADRKRVTPESATQYGLSRPRVGAMTPTQAAVFVESEMIRQKTDFEDKKNFNKLDAAWIKDQQTMHREFRKQQEKEEKAVFEAERDIHRQYMAYKKAKADQERAELARRIKEIEADEKKGLYDPQKRVLNVDKATPYDKERLAAFGPGLKGQSSPISEAYLDKARWAKGSFKGGDAFINDAKRYVKYAVNDLGMSITDAMKNVSKSTAAQKLSKDYPIGGSAVGIRSPRENALREIANSLTSIDKPLDSAGKKMGFLTNMMEKQREAVKRLGRYYISFSLITSFIRQVSEGFRQVIAVQEQMLELKKFLPQGANISGLQSQVYNIAADYGVPIDMVMNAYAEFAKQGKKDMGEIASFTKSALLGVNVASTDYATTVRYLTTVTNVWKGEITDTTEAIDKLAKTQAMSSASSEVLIAAMQRSASMARTMGMSVDQLFGYISAISEKTQLPGEVIGNSLKTIIERSRREKTLGMLSSISAFSGESFRSPLTQQLASAPQILETVARKWQNLTDVQQRNVAFQMAGGRQMNAFIALMENMQRAIEVTEGSLNSFGYAAQANESEMQKFSKSMQVFSTRIYEFTTAAILPFANSLSSLLRVFGELTNMTGQFGKGIIGALFGFAGMSGVVLTLGNSLKFIAGGFAQIGAMVGNFGKIISGLGVFGTSAQQAATSVSFLSSNWARFSRGWSLFMASAGSMRGWTLMLSSVGAILGPISLAVGAIGLGIAAWSSSTEDAAEKQKEFNDKLKESLDIYRKIDQRSSSSSSKREEASLKVAEKLTQEEMDKLGIRQEWSKTYQKYIPAFSSEVDYRRNRAAIQGQFLNEGAGGVKEGQSANFSKWLNTVMPIIEKLSENAPDQKVAIKDLLSALIDSSGRIAGRTTLVGVKRDENDIKLSNLIGKINNSKNYELSMQESLMLRAAQGSQSAQKILEIPELYSPEMAQLLKGSGRAFSNLLGGPGFGIDLKKIENIRKIDSTPTAAISFDQASDELKKYNADLEFLIANKKEYYKEDARAQQSNLSIIRTSSSSQLATMKSAVKEISSLNKQIIEAENKARTETYSGETGEDSDKKIKELKMELLAAQKAYESVLGGRTPEGIAQEHMEFIKKMLSSAPAGLQKIYESWAIGEVEQLENALKSAISAGQIDSALPPDILAKNMGIGILAESYRQEIAEISAARKKELRDRQLDAKNAQEVYMSIVKYGIDLSGQISKHLSRPSQLKSGFLFSPSDSWLADYRKETEGMINEMQSRKQSFDSLRDTMDTKTRMSEQKKLSVLQGKIEKRQQLMPYAGREFDVNAGAVQEYAMKKQMDLASALQKGISPSYLSKLQNELNTLKREASGKSIQLEQVNLATKDITKDGKVVPGTESIKKEIELLNSKYMILQNIANLASEAQYQMGAEEAEKRRIELIKEQVALKREEMGISGQIMGLSERLVNYNIASDQIIDIEKKINSEKQKRLQLLEEGKNSEAGAINNSIVILGVAKEAWETYRTSIYGGKPAIEGFSTSFVSSLQNIQRETQTGISFIDSLSSKLFALAGKVFTIGINFALSRSGEGFGGFIDNILGSIGQMSDYTKTKGDLRESFGALDKGGKRVMSSVYEAQESKALEALAKAANLDLQNAKDPRVVEYRKQLEEIKKAYQIPSEKGAGAAKRDQESTAHYNALERMKKAEADFQKQQQMASYWEGKSPDKYLLKYDAETRKYEAEMKAKKSALDSERVNLKPDEVKRLQEEINVLEHKIKLQNDYRKNAQEIAAFEQWQSDNKVGIERLRTEMAIRSEIYEMEFAALYSPSRAEEKAHLEWKIKSNLAELEAQKLIQVEEAKVVEMMRGKTEAEALSIALSSEEIQLLDLKIQKEQQMLGLIDRQLELKQKQKINEQVREVQGMISSGIFDALSLKSKAERKKQLAELAQELSKLSGESETASYGIAQAESAGNIDSINSARSKWNEVNKQIEEARKKMDEVNNSTNKWKEVLQNIGDSVLKKLSDKFAEMLINKTGLGDIFGTLFGSIDKINSGGKSSISAPSLSDPRTALGTLALGGLGGVAKGKGGIMDMFMPGVSNSSIQYNVSAAGGAGNPLGSLLGGGLNFGGGAKLPANYVAGARNGYTGRGIDASSAAKKYGTSQYLTSAMLGYAIGSSTSNRAVGALGGAAAGFLTGGPIGAIIGGLAGLFGRKKDDTPPPVQPAREFYALFKNSESLDRNTSALQKLSEGVWNAPSVFDLNKVQAERNMTAPTFNITINATSNSPKAIASEVNAAVSNAYQSSMGKMATSTSNWG